MQQLAANQRLGMAGRRPMAVRASAMATPPRVVPSTLLKIYVYDHCPFCVRVRLALGLKNVKHEVVFLANDDVATPTGLVGKKVAPILEMPGKIMGESMDIINVFESDPAYGATGMFKPSSGRKDIKAWQKTVQELLRLLHRPRYMNAFLPEFQQQDSRDYFIAGHQLPPYEKADWKANLTIEEKRKLYELALLQTPELLPQLNAALPELENLIFCDDYCTEGGLSMDDIDLWSRLRSVTLVKGAQFGPKTLKYLENLSARGDIPLYFSMAM